MKNSGNGAKKMWLETGHKLLPQNGWIRKAANHYANHAPNQIQTNLQRASISR